MISQESSVILDKWLNFVILIHLRNVGDIMVNIARCKMCICIVSVSPFIHSNQNIAFILHGVFSFVQNVQETWTLMAHITFRMFEYMML